MRVAVMQPYFYPYVGYFELLARVDRLVLLDDVQYIRRGWVNRNRIRSRQDPRGWQYLTVPVARAPRDARIEQIRLHPERDWVRRQCRTLESVFGETIRLHPLLASFARCAEEADDRLAPYLERTLVETAAILGLPVRIGRASELATDPGLRGQDRILAICERTGAEAYVNLPGGRGLYQAPAFRSRGVRLEFLDDTRYLGSDGRPNTFSILDLIFADGLDRVRAHLQQAPTSSSRVPVRPAAIEVNA